VAPVEPVETLRSGCWEPDPADVPTSSMSGASASEEGLDPGDLGAVVAGRDHSTVMVLVSSVGPADSPSDGSSVIATKV
jgi:hypothetical protein